MHTVQRFAGSPFHFLISITLLRLLEFEGGLGVLDLGRCSIIDEPVHLSRRDGAHPGRGKALLRLIQHGVERVCFIRTGRDKRDPGRMIENREGECDSLRRRLGAIGDVRDPTRLLGQERMSWEERAGVPVGADAEKDEVEDRETRRVLLGKLANELLFVCVRDFLECVLVRRISSSGFDQGGINGMDIFLRNRDFGPKMRLAEAVVGVFMIQWNDTFVGIEDLPVGHVSGGSPSSARVEDTRVNTMLLTTCPT